MLTDTMMRVIVVLKRTTITLCVGEMFLQALWKKGTYMQADELTQKIMNFGLTRQEALIYQYLVISGESTGYEVAKKVGISRSNAYSSLTSMVEKGAIYLQNGTTNKYLAVNVSEFCGNKIRTLENDKKDLEDRLKTKGETEGYVTIFGCQNIQDKIENMLSNVEHRVYISIAGEKLHLFKERLIKLIEEQKKVVIITDKSPNMDNCAIYLSNSLMENQIRLIVDSKYVLTGDFGESKDDTCLYSGQKNFVTLFKDAMRNEIELINLRSGKKNEN